MSPFLAAMESARESRMSLGWISPLVSFARRLVMLSVERDMVELVLSIQFEVFRTSGLLILESQKSGVDDFGHADLAEGFVWGVAEEVGLLQAGAGAIFSEPVEDRGCVSGGFNTFHIHAF
jgi:hypothetical protein